MKKILIIIIIMISITSERITKSIAHGQKYKRKISTKLAQYWKWGKKEQDGHPPFTVFD